MSYLRLTALTSIIYCSLNYEYSLLLWNKSEKNDKKENKENKKLKRNIYPIMAVDKTTIIPYITPTREEQINNAKNQEEVDILVIGGGVVGSGVALDAATRGLKTILVERDDFAAGTSSRSTKLIHGGVRYLEKAFKDLDWSQYQLVDEALEEREFLLKAAPYMNHALPIMIPLYSSFQVPYFWVGAKFYDLIAGKARFVPNSQYISKEEALFRFPMLKSDDLKGAIIYYDGQMNDARLSLTIALTATQHGATICNGVEVKHLIKNNENKVVGAHVRDKMTNEEWDIYSKVVINATGPFVDSIRHMADNLLPDIIIPAAGVHIILPDHFSPAEMGLLVPETSDGRIVFFLPFEDMTLSGTTDSKSDLTMLPKPTQEEVKFIINEANRYLTKPIKKTDVTASWSGIRPLALNPKKLKRKSDPNEKLDHSSIPTSAISREHVVELIDEGLITICGGKWTTYRKMAEDAVDKAFEYDPDLYVEGLISKKSKTSSLRLIGADRARIVCDQKFDRITVLLRDNYSFPVDVAKYLVRNYGTRSLQIAEIVKHGHPLFPERELGKIYRLSQRFPILEAEVIFAVEQEYALKAVDVLARRTRLAFLDAQKAHEAMPKVIDMMARLLNWNDKKKKQEEKDCREFLKTMTSRKDIFKELEEN